MSDTEYNKLAMDTLGVQNSQKEEQPTAGVSTPRPVPPQATPTPNRGAAPQEAEPQIVHDPAGFDKAEFYPAGRVPKEKQQQDAAYLRAILGEQDAEKYKAYIKQVQISSTQGLPTFKLADGQQLQLRLHPETGRLAQISVLKDDVTPATVNLMMTMLEKSGHSISLENLTFEGSAAFQRNITKLWQEELARRQANGAGPQGPGQGPADRGPSSPTTRGPASGDDLFAPPRFAPPAPATAAAPPAQPRPAPQPRGLRTVSDEKDPQQTLLEKLVAYEQTHRANRMAKLVSGEIELGSKQDTDARATVLLINRIATEVSEKRLNTAQTQQILEDMRQAESRARTPGQPASVDWTKMAESLGVELAQAATKKGQGQASKAPRPAAA